MATLSASTNHDETTPKRGRGRPRKNTSTSTPAAKTPSTRGRGRPPKSVSAVKKTPSTNNATKPRGRPRKTLTAPSPVRTPISKGRGRPRKDGASSSKLRGAGPTQPIAQATMETPNKPIHFVPAGTGEILAIGPMTLRILEDGSHTDNRLGMAELIIPPHTTGPTPHWHEMHDDGFLITAGTVRFHTPASPSNAKESHTDAPTGSWFTVPTRAPHTFSNPFDVEARFMNTFTPAFYINYFRLLSGIAKAGEPLTREANETAMRRFGTVPLPGEAVEEGTEGESATNEDGEDGGNEKDEEDGDAEDAEGGKQGEGAAGEKAMDEVGDGEHGLDGVVMEE